MFPQLTQIVFVIADSCLMNSHLTAVITSVIKKFHFSCLRMSDPIPKTRYCPSCHLLPQFQTKTGKKGL